jgi:long-chain acyl-CoA synthetase
VRQLLNEADPVAAFVAAHSAAELIGLPTSGTTQQPRMVVRTTASWVRSFAAVSELAHLDAAARVWIPGPLTSTMNLFAAVHAQAVGAIRVSRAADATHLQVTPAALHRLLDAGTELAGRTAVVAGDALRPELRERAERARLRVAHYYGSAELSFVGWGSDAASLRPFPGVDVAVRNGVLWARSPFLAERVDGPPGPFRRDSGGFATVGDRGGWEEDRLVVAGRDAAVVTGGNTVLLADVEAALQRGLAGQVTVLGLPHPTLGAVVVAVLTDDADRAPARAAADGLGAGRPRRWFVRTALPLTEAGKVDRRALAAELQQA